MRPHGGLRNESRSRAVESIATDNATAKGGIMGEETERNRVLRALNDILEKGASGRNRSAEPSRTRDFRERRAREPFRSSISSRGRPKCFGGLDVGDGCGTVEP